MSLSIPKFILNAFAKNGLKNAIPESANQVTGDAGYIEGFPPVTFIPKIAGGIPPKGRDFNGIFYDMSAALQYVQSGMSFPFDAAFAEAIGGYAKGAIVSDDDGSLLTNTVPNNTEYPEGWNDASVNDYMPKSGGTFTGKIALSANADLPLEAVPLGQIALLMQPALTASATFTQATNNIAMTGIVSALGLEIGDVIQVTGSTSNNRLSTIEFISDANNVVVNAAHKNGAGSLSLVGETANVTIKRIAKWFNAPLGLGQSWVVVSRVAGSTYTNTTGRSIGIAVINLGTLTTLTVSGVQVGRCGTDLGGQGYQLSAVVGSAAAYSIVGGAIINTSELR